MTRPAKRPVLAALRVHANRVPAIGLWLLFALSAAGCHPDQAEAGKREVVDDRQDSGWVWPTDEAGRIRQLSKYVEDLELNPELAIFSDLPGGRVPAVDLTPIGVECVDASEVVRLIDSDRWLVVDVRKRADVESVGVIPGSVQHPYRFQGARYPADRRALDRELSEELLESYDGLVIVCNGPI